MDDAAWMRHALELGEQAAREEDEIPVGAVIVGLGGPLVARQPWRPRRRDPEDDIS